MVSPPTFILECFGIDPASSSASNGRKSEKRRLLAHQPANADDDLPARPCIFCDVKTENGFKVVLEDAHFVAFNDRSPAASLHLLVVPRRHIANIKTLRPGAEEDCKLIEDMKSFGSRALELAQQGQPDSPAKLDSNARYPDDVPGRRYGFHIPPFRSVEHLHLHCLQLPFVSSLRALKYRVAQPGSSPDSHKGWSWFVQWQQAVDILRSGNRIKVGAC